MVEAFYKMQDLEYATLFLHHDYFYHPSIHVYYHN